MKIDLFDSIAATLAIYSACNLQLCIAFPSHATQNAFRKSVLILKAVSEWLPNC